MKQNSLDEALHLAIEQARITLNADIGGPFGAAVIDPKGKILAIASNTVLRDHDPTAHAEMNALRIAGQKMKTHDLKGCTLVSTAYPCPMCCAAIIWANIKEVYYGATAKDAAEAGFRDSFMYDYLKDSAVCPDLINLHPLDKEAALTLFQEYKAKSKQLY